MSKIAIDITKYDRPKVVSYFFTEEEFKYPKKTFKKFGNNKSSFQNGGNKKKYEIKLTAKQDAELSKYLNEKYFNEDGGVAENADFAIAFSYGMNPDVNIELAFRIIDLIKENHKIKVYAQWEIVNELRRLNSAVFHKVISLGLDYGEDYITTDGIIDKFIEAEEKLIKATGKRKKVMVIGQAWHSVRCIDTCINKGLSIEGQRVVDKFSISDPQPWVRNAFAWILKEATKPKK